MALLLKTFDLNQKVTNALHLTFPLVWDHSKKRWNVESTRNLKFHYFFNIAFLGGGGLSILLILAWISRQNPKWFSSDQKTILVMECGGVPFLVFIDLIMTRYAQQVVKAMNWLIGAKWSNSRRLDAYKADLSMERILLEEFLKILGGAEKVDWLGLLAFYAVLASTFLSVIIPIFIVWLGLDPYHMILISINASGYLNITAVIHSPITKILRSLGALMVCLPWFINAKVTVLAGFCMIDSRAYLLKYLHTSPFSVKPLKLYKEFAVCEQIVAVVENWFLGGYLTSMFYLIILLLSMSIYTWRLLPLKLYLFIPFAATMLSVMLIIVFQTGCSLHQESSEVLNRWGKQVVGEYRLQRKYARKVLKSLRPLAMQVGGIGIMDRDIKGNYFLKFLEYFANVLIFGHHKLLATHK